jgi:hypothetical protein
MRNLVLYGLLSLDGVAEEPGNWWVPGARPRRMTSIARLSVSGEGAPHGRPGGGRLRVRLRDPGPWPRQRRPGHLRRAGAGREIVESRDYVDHAAMARALGEAPAASA